MSAAAVVLPQLFLPQPVSIQPVSIQQVPPQQVPIEQVPVRTVLPFVWAFARREAAPEAPGSALEPQMDLYRKYTEALLRRYVRLSMEAGRVPSLLGRELFRGKVTNYRVGAFDDVVIFVHDVERCIQQLTPEQQDLITRIGLQQFTAIETAELLALPPKLVIYRYGKALDLLTTIFLDVGMLEPQKCCQ